MIPDAQQAQEIRAVADPIVLKTGFMWRARHGVENKYDGVTYYCTHPNNPNAPRGSMAERVFRARLTTSGEVVVEQIKIITERVSGNGTTLEVRKTIKVVRALN